MLWRRLLLAFALLNVAWGFFALFAPERAAGLINYRLGDLGTMGEFRSVYGALMIALGLALLLAPFRKEGPTWLRLLGAGFGALVVGRLFSLALDGFHLYTLLTGLLEAAVIWLLVYCAAKFEAGPAPRAEPKPPDAS